MTNLTNQQLTDVRYALKYYMMNHVSLTNPRYKEYEEILELLTETRTLTPA